MKLHPKRDGNPKRFFMGAFLLNLLTLGGLLLFVALEEPENFPIIFALLL